MSGDLIECGDELFDDCVCDSKLCDLNDVCVICDGWDVGVCDGDVGDGGDGDVCWECVRGVGSDGGCVSDDVGARRVVVVVGGGESVDVGVDGRCGDDGM